MDEELILKNFNSLLVIPSIITLITIAAIFYFKRWRSLLLENKLIFGIILSLLLMNFLEVVTFGNIYKNYEFLLRAYYSAAIITSSFIFCLSERLNETELLPRNWMYIFIILLNLALIFLIFASNQIVAGVSRNNFTILRVPGNRYWLFQLYVLACVAIGPLLIFKSIHTTKNPLVKKRNVVILYAFLPITITVIFVIALMQLGLEINWSIFLPICTLLFVVVYLYTENKQDLFKFLVKIPYSRERKAYIKLNDEVIEYISKSQTDEKLSLKEVMARIENRFIINALDVKDGNHNLAAELLSISLSTIYRHKDTKDEK